MELEVEVEDKTQIFLRLIENFLNSFKFKFLKTVR